MKNVLMHNDELQITSYKNNDKENLLIEHWELSTEPFVCTPTGTSILGLLINNLLLLLLSLLPDTWAMPMK